MSEPVAFFEQDGERFIPSVLTRGPWRPEHQHGGPPSALMARAIEGEAGSLHLARFTIDFVRPVPIEPLTLRLERTRDGRRAQGYEVELCADGQVVARATALVMRAEPAAAPSEVLRELLEPPPSESEPFQFPFFRSSIGYHTATESRLARGRVGSGKAALWMRQRVPLVAGETPSPAQRILLMADSGSGVGAVLDPVRFMPFINADLSVSLHRLPEGEWMGLDAVTTVEPHGIGLTRTRLYDRQGLIGEGLQALVAGRMTAP
jgi:acyl-CoA thioesterase